MTVSHEHRPMDCCAICLERPAQCQCAWARSLCMSENSVADRARFFEAYADAERRNDSSEKMLPEVKALALRLSARLLTDKEQER